MKRINNLNLQNMNRDENIKIEKGTMYLSEKFDELPSNCVFDKGRVGCGGTSIALECSYDAYVIVVPFIPLIINKMSQYNSLIPHSRCSRQICGVMQGVYEEEVSLYLEKAQREGWKPVFMVTYESFKRLTSYINPSEYKLLVDELHILFIAYKFRDDGVRGVLDNYKKYHDYCFMSASVMEKGFMLEELSDIRIVRAKWEEEREVTINSVLCENNVKYAVAYVIGLYLNDELEGNAYFFVNSVEFINQMIAFCGLDESNTRVIYSDNNKKNLTIPRGKPSDEPKKINFITSTAFEGVDIMDENGRIYIVSDNSKPHTMLDVSSSVVQIVGRIRNTRYWDNIYHIYTPSPYMTTTYDAYKLKTDENIAKAKRIVDIHNNETTDEYRQFVKVGTNDYYVTTTDNNMLKFDANLPKLDLYNFKTTRYLYSSTSTLHSEYQQYGFNVKPWIYTAPEIEAIAAAESLESFNFKDTIIKLKEYLESGFGGLLYSLAIREASVKWPDIRHYIEQFGFEGIEERGYNIGNIGTEYIAKYSDMDQRNKIYNMLLTKLNLEYSNKVTSLEAKSHLQEIYDSLGLQKTAKGSDLKHYFDIKDTTRRRKITGDDGTQVIKSVRMYEIGAHNLMFERMTKENS